ncbi:hypothetical protein CORC01_08965, partial [Colletotrichum orchidophilum]
LQSNQAYTEYFDNVTAAAAIATGGGFFLSDISVTKRQVCGGSYQKCMALLSGPTEPSRKMSRSRRRIDRECISNKTLISGLPCLNSCEAWSEAGRDQVEQDLEGSLPWLALSHPRICTAHGRRTRHAGCLANLSKRRSR